jgi:hypothetical protein
MSSKSTTRLPTMHSRSIRGQIRRYLEVLLGAPAPAPSPVPIPVRRDDRPIRLLDR